MLRSAAILVASSVCVIAAGTCAIHLWQFFADPENSYRHEYLEGAFLVGGLSFVAWAPLLLAAVHSKSGLKTWQRRLGLFAGSVAAAGWAAPIALSMLPN